MLRDVHNGPLDQAGDCFFCADHVELRYFGSAVFAMEGIALLLPVENAMAEPHLFPKVRRFAENLRMLDENARAL